MAAEWHNGCWLGLEESVGVWLLGLRWGLCCCWGILISIVDGFSDTEGTDDTVTEGTNVLSREFDAYRHVKTVCSFPSMFKSLVFVL